MKLNKEAEEARKLEEEMREAQCQFRERSEGMTLRDGLDLNGFYSM